MVFRRIILFYYFDIFLHNFVLYVALRMMLLPHFIQERRFVLCESDKFVRQIGNIMFLEHISNLVLSVRLVLDLDDAQAPRRRHRLRLLDVVRINCLLRALICLLRWRLEAIHAATFVKTGGLGNDGTFDRRGVL